MEGMSDRYCSEQFGVPQARMDEAIKGDFTEEVIFEQGLGSGVILTAELSMQ